MRQELSRVRKEFSNRLPKKDLDEVSRRRALRTAFVARFIVLREGRRSRAHRIIEQMCWSENTTADELREQFRLAFVENGDKLEPVERDLHRAMEHAQYSADCFADQYNDRSSLSFQDSLADYVRSNKLLFGDESDDVPRSGGWRLPDAV